MLLPALQVSIRHGFLVVKYASLLLRSRLAMAALPIRTGSSERCFVVESASSELVYFTLRSNSERPLIDGARPQCFVPRPGRCYSFCIPAAPSPRDRIRAARLHRTLQQRLSQEPFGARSRVLALLSYSAQEPVLESGFLVQSKQRSPETERSLEELLRLLLPAPALLSVYEEAEDGEVWRALWGLKAAEGKELLERRRVVAAEGPQLHPAAFHLFGTALFSSLGAAREVLEECTSLIPEAKAVLDVVDKCPKHPKKGDFPVIVVEGLDATGKTTVTQALKDSLNATLVRTPPPCVSQWRKIFDDEPTLIRRAFYALSNYLVASEIAKESMKSPVIVDRYWHSTAAYAIATEMSGKVENLPPLHHQVYHWPEDLLRPDIVLLLSISAEERIRRLQGRGLERTREEAELETNSVFRQKVEECYRRMENPACQPVDASPSREEVLKTALHLIKKHCHLV
ncbi:UMP-CMP kinase 2, mitochondrial isoform X1 [Varanus komodoensis]|uniref:UMP-CMP kinase 2, mitochondrial isoform X1 n=1 Tax=Varanus komodoensis TaxID=61221 RepID=UPI001CF785B1|nr:UMP-CMP kinase 2, mitochondrial isoform X1 [Varanus komodoensis]